MVSLFKRCQVLRTLTGFGGTRPDSVRSTWQYLLIFETLFYKDAISPLPESKLHWPMILRRDLLKCLRGEGRYSHSWQKLHSLAVFVD